jgi:SAM-dependent methyltransferase
MRHVKGFLNSFAIGRAVYTFLRAGREFFRVDVGDYIKGMVWFIGDYRTLLLDTSNVHCSVDLRYAYPCLRDKTSVTPVDITYFYQDTWAARKIFEMKPRRHYDVGSHAKTVGLLSQFIPVTMVDIRPLEVNLSGLSFAKASVVELPFRDNSIDSISSLCVVEHIGLGRYGDPVDPFGSEMAIGELQRVVSSGGVILFSVPVDSQDRVYFNAHRAFTRHYVLELFAGFVLLEEKYIYRFSMVDAYEPAGGFGTGLFMFRKAVGV